MLNGRSGSAERGSQALIRERPSFFFFLFVFRAVLNFSFCCCSTSVFVSVCVPLGKVGSLLTSVRSVVSKEIWFCVVLFWPGFDLARSIIPPPPLWIFKYSYLKLFWIVLVRKCVSSRVILVHGYTRKRFILCSVWIFKDKKQFCGIWWTF